LEKKRRKVELSIVTRGYNDQVGGIIRDNTSLDKVIMYKTLVGMKFNHFFEKNKTKKQKNKKRKLFFEKSFSENTMFN
jgi:hypothetical protein